MDVIILGLICVVLCLHVLQLQKELREARIAVGVMAEGMKKLADGEIELERTPEGIKIMMKKGGK